MTAPCSDCGAPATSDAYAGWRCIAGRWLMQTRPLCDWCEREDLRARAEKAAS